MPFDEQEKLDILIEAALRDEAKQDLPFGFHRAVEERVQMAALLDLERGRFRRCWQSAVAFVTLVAVATTLGWIFGDIATTLVRTVPGALGSYDQFMLLLAAYWPAMTLTSIAMVTILGCTYFVLSLSLSPRRSAPERG